MSVTIPLQSQGRFATNGIDVIRKSVIISIQSQGMFATNIKDVIMKSVTRPMQALCRLKYQY